MKKKQTIRLNESQLHRIIKESVKNLLKENDNEPNNKYIVTRVEGFMVENSYQNGESGSENWWHDTCTIYGDSIKDVVDNVANKYFFEGPTFHVFIYDDTIRFQQMSDVNGNYFDNTDLEEWRNGEIIGYNSEMLFRVHKYTTCDHDELVSAGFESYD